MKDKRITFRLRATIHLVEAPYSQLADQEVAITVDRAAGLSVTQLHFPSNNQPSGSSLMHEAFLRLEEDLNQAVAGLILGRPMGDHEKALASAGIESPLQAEIRKIREGAPNDSPNPL